MSSKAMMPLMEPSAPPEDMQMPPPPPTYTEAMGWAPPPNAPGPAYPPYPPNQQMPTGHRPLVNVTANPMAIQPAIPAPVHQQPASYVVVQHAPVVMVGPKSAKVECPVCHASIKTTTVTTNKCLAHISCLVLMFIGCWPCCWIPYCMDSCKQVTHTCPNCKSFLGTYNG